LYGVYASNLAQISNGWNWYGLWTAAVSSVVINYTLS